MAGDVQVGVLRSALNVVAGTQDFTISGLGFTPNAAIIETTAATVNGTATADSILSIGVTDGTNQASILFADEDGADPTDTSRTISDDEVIYVPVAGLAFVNQAVQFDSFISNGIRLDVTDAQTARFVKITLFGGADFNAAVGIINPNDAATVPVSGIGIAPNALFMISGIAAADREAVEGDAYSGVGWAADTGAGIDHIFMGINSVNGQAFNHDLDGGLHDTIVCGRLNDGAPFESYEVDSFDTTGFTLGRTVQAFSSTGRYIYLAMDMDDRDMAIGTYTVPTSIGDDSEASLSFTPQYLSTLMGKFDTINNAESFTVECESFFLGSMTADDEYSNGYAIDLFGQDSDSYSHDSGLFVQDRQGVGALTRGTLSSFNADGWTFNFTDVEAARLWGYFALQEAAAGGATLIVQDTLHSHTLDSPSLVQANTLAMQDTDHAHTVDVPILAQQNTIAVQESQHGHTVDALTLVQQNVLALQGTDHAHSVDSVLLAQDNVLVVSESLHGHTVDLVQLTQANILTIDDVDHGHSVDSPVLNISLTLEMSELSHGHTAGNIDLSQANILAIDGATHSHLADNITLIAGLNLVVQESLHSSQTDNVDLVQAAVLQVLDTLHDHLIDAPVLNIGGLLLVEDSLHSQSIDDPVLIQQNILIVNDSLHQQLADNINLQIGGIETPGGRIFVVKSDKRTIFIAANGRISIN